MNDQRGTQSSSSDDGDIYEAKPSDIVEFNQKRTANLTERTLRNSVRLTAGGAYTFRVAYNTRTASRRQIARSLNRILVGEGST